MLPKVRYLIQILLLPSRQRKNGHAHGHNFYDLGSNSDLAFAEAVCQKAASHAEYDKRNKKQHRDQRYKPVTANMGHGRPQHHEREQIAQHVEAERALKLRNDQRPEAEPPVLIERLWLRISNSCR